MLALWLADVLRDAGLNVVEEPHWQLRGKPFIDIRGHMAHHTASPRTSTLAVNLSVVTNGNSVAPGPIANDLLWRDGTYHIIAAGRCNHAGKGVLPWVPLDQGNTHLLSTEAVNDGVGEPWSDDMIAAYEIGTAAKLRYLGLSAARATTHAEYAPSRKIDPAGPTGGRIATLPGRLTWDPNAWRARVDSWLSAPTPPIEKPTPPPVPPATPIEEDVMPIVTNAEQLFDSAPNVAKFGVREDGTIRMLSPAEWRARGSKDGTPVSNADIGLLWVER